MGERSEKEIFIDGQEIKSISEGELNINYEQNTVERDCEIKTTYGVIHFKAVFTREQWDEFVEISRKVG
jgi:hypothetical protein